MNHISLKHYMMQIISLCGLISCSLGICINSQGVFFAPASKELHIMIGTFSLQNTISYIITSFAAVYYARIAQHYSYTRLLLMGAVLTSMSFVIMGFTSNVVIFFLLGILRGIGSGTFAMAIVTIGINNWFKEKTGLITSIVFSTSGIAGMIFPPLFTTIIEISSWRSAYIVMGVLSFLLIVPSLCTRFALYPQHNGRIPYGSMHHSEIKGHSHTIRFQMIFIVLIAISIIYNIVLGFAQHLPAYAISITLSGTIGSFMLSLCMFGNVISKLMTGIIADRIGSIRSTIMMITINLLSLCMLFLLRNTFLLEISSFCYGMMYAVITVCLTLLTKEFYRDEAYNAVFPIISLAGGIANSIAVSILGYVYDFSSSYDMVFVLLLILHAAGALMMLILIRKDIKNRRTMKSSAV